MSLPSSIGSCIALATVASIINPALSIEVSSKGQAQDEVSSPPKQMKTVVSKLMCQSLCAQQQLGVRLEEAERKAYQQCFAQALCRIEVGPPVVYQPPSQRWLKPEDLLRSPQPYGAFPDGRV